MSQKFRVRSGLIELVKRWETTAESIVKTLNLKIRRRSGLILQSSSVHREDPVGKEQFDLKISASHWNVSVYIVTIISLSSSEDRASARNDKA